MSIHFGAVKIVMQPKVLKAQDEYAEKVEAVYQRIRGDVRIMGFDREVEAVVKQELGDPPDSRQVMKEAEERFNRHLEAQAAANGQDPEYRALMLNKGNLANPLKPAEKALQKLLIDGEDLKRFFREVTEEAFFRKPVYTNGLLSGSAVAPTRNETDPYPGKGIESHFSRVADRYYREVVEQIKQGQTDKALDLDA